MPLTIALDGPVGAGKSSVADEAARRLGILHLDTGAMYRAIGLYTLRQGIPLSEEEAVSALAEKVRVDVRYTGGAQHTLVEGEDVTGLIRTPEVSMAASTVARYARVRQAMVALQRRLAAEQPMLVDGRDIGTTVFPDAEVKIFMTASDEVRAQRRFDEMKAKGQDPKLEDVMKNLRERDYIDSHREVSPLSRAADAFVLDNSDMNLHEELVWFQGLAQGRFGILE